MAFTRTTLFGRTRKPAGTPRRSWAAGLFALIVLCAAPAASAQTVLTASDAAGLVTAITTIDDNPNNSYTLNITQNITLTGATTLPAIESAGTVTINGGGHTLDGGGVQRGLFVYTGTVAVNNLTIQNAVAQGGNGGPARTYAIKSPQDVYLEAAGVAPVKLPE